MMHVLLSATVTPNTSLYLAVTDPGQRAQQYRAAIANWSHQAKRHSATVYVAENSGSLDLIRRSHSNVRYLDVTTAEIGLDNGKGAQEATLLTRACTELIAQGEIDKDTVLVKCTGRLSIDNSRAIFAFQENRSFRCLVSLERRWLDTRLFVSPVLQMLEVLDRLENDVDERNGQFLEHAMFRRLSELRTPIQTFRRPPAFFGISGTSGTQFGSPLRRLIRPLTPSPLLRRPWSYWLAPQAIPTTEP